MAYEKDMKHRHDEFYQALLNRDSQFLGSFVAAVKTTGIFCLPTCTARKPKKHNVDFYPDAAAALRAGYRPCKICTPTSSGVEMPPDVYQAMSMIAGKEAPRVRDADLRAAGIVPETVRRWCKRRFGMTFQAYQRLLRLNASYSALKSGSGVLEAGLAANYESESGFYHAYERVMRQSPGARGRTPVITIQHIDTSLGPMLAGTSDQGLCLLEFTDRRMLETQLNTLHKRLGAVYLYGDNDILAQTKAQLAAYFDGSLTRFTIALDTPGTEFQNEVWKVLQRIPYGQTQSYAAQAREIGRPRAVRAVAAANGHNRIAIIIPCHRVIGSDGSLTGYGGGMPRKRWLLAHEARVAEADLPEPVNGDRVLT